MSAQFLLFAVLATIAVVCGVLMILQENPVRSALYLVLVLFSVALLFLSLNAAFIAAVQIIVYAGAIMVLFIFVIMLLNLGTPDKATDQLKPQTWIGAPIVAICMLALFGFITMSGTPTPPSVHLSPNLIGAQEIGISLYSPNNYWLFPFEVVSILLLVAAIGAVMLAKKRI
jgi:NADH-quinone oxidoreductase subunit J